MEILPKQKIREVMNSSGLTRESLMNLYAKFDDIYKSSLELKILSQSIDILAGKLSDLDKQRNQADAVVPVDALARLVKQDQRHRIIALERDIYTQQLPEFLQKEFVAAAGSVAGLTPTQALFHYKATLDRMASAKTASIGPIHAPPPFSSGGVTITFSANNPKINAPLTKPELEALSELVHLQKNTSIGVKWLSYHEALLKRESARRLSETSNAFNGLAERSNEAEQIKNGIKFTADFYKEITEKFGERMSSLAKELSENVRGKKIRNAEEALKAFEQYKKILNKKFNAQDRKAIADALDALDKDLMAQNLTRFGKGLGSVGNAMDLFDLYIEVEKGMETDDWKPFFFKAETVIAGKLATALVAFVFGLTATTPVGILGFALLIALTSSLVDDALIGKINNYIISL